MTFQELLRDMNKALEIVQESGDEEDVQLFLDTEVYILGPDENGHHYEDIIRETILTMPVPLVHHCSPLASLLSGTTVYLRTGQEVQVYFGMPDEWEWRATLPMQRFMDLRLLAAARMDKEN